MNTVDFAWLAEHGIELQRKYAGKWIAVHDGRVIGIGDTAVEADEQAQAACASGDYILQAIERSADVVYAEF